MAFTVHDTPVIRVLIYGLASIIFKGIGWKVEGQKPDVPSFVVIAAPHTSNWDFVLTICLIFIFRTKAFVMLKSDWFRWPMGPFFKWIGAIPIDRARSQGVVAESVKQFAEDDKMIMLVAPTGTRQKVMYWKTGFYHIAHGAGVPIVLGFMDYGRKTGGLGPSFMPTGDIEADMKKIRQFYKGIKGKYPQNDSGAPI